MNATHINRLSKQADKIIRLTVKEAQQLPDMLGRIAPVMLGMHGYYTCTVDGEKVLYLNSVDHKTESVMSV